VKKEIDRETPGIEEKRKGENWIFCGGGKKGATKTAVDRPDTQEAENWSNSRCKVQGLRSSNSTSKGRVETQKKRK